MRWIKHGRNSWVWWYCVEVLIYNINWMFLLRMLDVLSWLMIYLRYGLVIDLWLLVVFVSHFPNFCLKQLQVTSWLQNWWLFWWGIVLSSIDVFRLIVMQSRIIMTSFICRTALIQKVLMKISGTTFRFIHRNLNHVLLKCTVLNLLVSLFTSIPI